MLKFSLEEVVEAEVLERRRLSVARPVAVNYAVIAGGTLVGALVGLSAGRGLAGYVAQDLPSLVQGFIWLWVSLLGLFVGLVGSYTGLASLFKPALHDRAALVPVSGEEAAYMVHLAEQHPALEAYRQLLAATRCAVKGDFDLMCQEAARLDELAAAKKKAKAEQESLERLHQPTPLAVAGSVGSPGSAQAALAGFVSALGFDPARIVQELGADSPNLTAKHLALSELTVTRGVGAELTRDGRLAADAWLQSLKQPRA